jgi:hypothetical protein
MEAYAQQLRLVHGILSFEIVPDAARCHCVVNRTADHSTRRQRPARSRWDCTPSLHAISSDHRESGISPMESSRKVVRKSSSGRDFIPRLPTRSIDVVAPPLLSQSRERSRPMPLEKQVSERAEIRFYSPNEWPDVVNSCRAGSSPSQRLGRFTQQSQQADCSVAFRLEMMQQKVLRVHC